MRISAALIFTLAVVSLCCKAQVTADDLDWNFEGGSLAAASTLADNDISLTLRGDSGAADLYGWYDFRIRQHAQGQLVQLRFVNCDNWVTADHRPVYSYDGRHWMRFFQSWMEGNVLLARQLFAADSVEVALVFPYRYSDLLADLDSLTVSPFVSIQDIGQSVHGRTLKLVTVTDPAVPVEGKRVAWIISRQHPMETPPAYALRTMMQWLAADNDTSAALLQRLVFKIVPAVNVDGVAEGFSRHNANGINLNRNWNTVSGYSGEESEVEAVHRAIDEWYAAGHSIDLFLDMHAAPDAEDFGYRFSAAYSSPAYYAASGRALQCVETRVPHQAAANWRDLDQDYGAGLSIMAVYSGHGTMCLSSEYPWSRHADGTFVTLEELGADGPLWAMAIDDFLFPTGASPRYNAAVDLSFTVEPNPFNGETALRFVMPQGGRVELDIFDNLGRRVGSPLNGFFPAGEQRILWDARAFPSGAYYARVKTRGESAHHRLILIR